GGVLGVDAEAFELDARGGSAGAEVDAPVGDQVEHRDRLGGAHGVVVRLRHQAHAVAEAHVRGAGRDRAVEHLGVGAVRVLLEEVVLDGPEGVEAGLLAGDRLRERVLVGEVLAVGTPGTGDGDLVEEGEPHVEHVPAAAPPAGNGDPPRPAASTLRTFSIPTIASFATIARVIAGGAARGGGVRAVGTYRAVACPRSATNAFASFATI